MGYVGIYVCAYVYGTENTIHTTNIGLWQFCQTVTGIAELPGMQYPSRQARARVEFFLAALKFMEKKKVPEDLPPIKVNFYEPLNKHWCKYITSI